MKSEPSLSELPLTEDILQSCYKSKTYVRNGQWDILWYLGGKNDVTIGEKASKFYLLPSEKVETVIDVLPWEIVQGKNITSHSEVRHLPFLSDLDYVYPELTEYIRKGRIRLKDLDLL